MPAPDGESRFTAWVRRLVLCCLFGLVVALVAVLVLTNRAAARTTSVPRPRLIALAYGRFRPQGAPHSYLALRFMIDEPHGQILETTYQEINVQNHIDGIGGVGDSECGIGGRRDGGIETTFIPLGRPLTAGIHHIRVTATGSLCDRTDATSKSSKVFLLRVGRKQRPAAMINVRLSRGYDGDGLMER